MKCPYCGSSRFRLSHLRLKDTARLVFFRYPVRCRLCRERSYVSLSKAMSIRHLHHQVPDEKATQTTEEESVTAKH